MKTVIFDLDGTLADLTHRLHHVRNSNNRWDKFFKACVDDKPIESVCALARMLMDMAFDADNPIALKIIVVSGRSDEVRNETEEWLERHNLTFHELIMRPAGDYTPDHILKERILDQLLKDGHEILFVVDDRQRVVDMWRRRGITCLQAAAWDEDDAKSVSAKKGLLTLLIGPCGAGKSSFLNGERPLNNKEKPSEWVYVSDYGIHPSHIISSDQIRKDLCGDFRDQTRNAEVFAALHHVAKARINSGLPTVIDATNIKAADRKAAVALVEGNRVRYIVIDRPMEEKRRDGGWRNEVGFDLLQKHSDTFNSNLKSILKGDYFSNVEVVDLRKM